jgi:gamma-D-glutamyl-L-lysine dipeptidyl-peptidase
MTDEPEQLVVTAPIATLFAEPRVASAPISQLLAGRIVENCEERDDWFRVVGPDEYEGWMHHGYVARVRNDADAARIRASRISLGCVTTTAAGYKRNMPLGAYLTDDERIATGEAMAANEKDERFPSDVRAIVHSAQLYFEGASYIWGGVTPWGCDCSGLVQSTYWLHGTQLHRDAWQQASQGAPAEAALLDARVGDLLFFSDRVDQHITHVAISLGDCRLVHLALGRGGYAVERLDDSDDRYVQKLHERFVTARRILT